ncbi:MAG: hypothetical protein ACRD3G_26360 [Vicinamibacterales bacterium]
MRNEPALSEHRESNGRDPLDALIDHAAQQIVAGEPSSSLRSAVRDRIEHRRSAWSLSPAIAGVAAAVVIAAVLVGRTLLPDVGRTLSGPAGERVNVRPTIERVAIPAPPAPSVESDTRGVRLTRRLADEVAAPPQEEESLISPIAVEPLEPVQIAVGNPITVDSSGVMPIEVAPLQLEPLRGIE